MTAENEYSTQRAEILALLKSWYPNEVPTPEVAKLALQYNTRIKELREAGWPIKNRKEKVNGQWHTWFRLLTLHSCTDDHKGPDRGNSLFGDLTPWPGYPD